MRTLFFDTETSGLPINYKAPVTDLGNWPRLVQLGYIVYDDGQELVAMEHVIKPNGFVISEQVSRIHGITQEFASSLGEPLEDVLRTFRSWLDNTDEWVGHNLSYDMNVLGAEYLRVFQSNSVVGKSTYDTMLKGTNLCRLPGMRVGSYKWPKLHELYQYLFHEPLQQTHTALDDIRNTAKCYFEMKRLGVV